MAEVIFNKLEKVYSNGFKAVHGIDLKIADGEFMVIVGPSGCAKSTTLRMLAGWRPSAAARCGLGTKSSTTRRLNPVASRWCSRTTPSIRT